MKVKEIVAGILAVPFVVLGIVTGIISLVIFWFAEGIIGHEIKIYDD